MPLTILPTLIPSLKGADLVRLLMQAWDQAEPSVLRLLSDPQGSVARVGEILVWRGPTGQQVIGGLEMLADSSARIEGAVNGIESAQLAAQGILGVVQSVSIATLGVTSLSGAFMALRLQALARRIDALGKAIRDVEGKVDAQNKAHLKSSIQFLREFDDHPDDSDKLRRALDEARRATNVYSEIAAEEAAGRPVRLPVLNCRSRLYMVALLTELRCIMSTDDSKQALARIEDELPHVRQVARAFFDNTLKMSPERYLGAAFQEHEVGLGLLTSVYQQAHSLGVITQPKVADANDMFEHMRKSIGWRMTWGGEFSGGGIKWLAQHNVEREMQSLRYLLACLEESARIEGLKLMIGAIGQKGGSLSDLVCRLRRWREGQGEREMTGDPVFAYGL